MESILLLCAVVIVICIVASRLSQRLGVPALLLFLALGMLFGSDGLFRIPFDNFEAAERICSVALIFIMFYGGFGTRWEAARPAAARAVVLSTLGVAVTALLTALFCHFALGFSVLESFLTGAVISSTDAASVFSILRSKKLGLRNHTASLLEVESGSNDPASYMLTVIALSLMGVGGGGAIPWMIFAQVVFGLGLGAVRNFNFIGCGMILLAWASLFFCGNNYAGIITGVILIDIGMQCIQLSNQTSIFDIYPSASNRVNTIFMTTYFIGGSLGTFLAGSSWQTWGWSGVVGTGVILTIISLSITLYSKK